MPCLSYFEITSPRPDPRGYPLPACRLRLGGGGSYALADGLVVPHGPGIELISYFFGLYLIVHFHFLPSLV